jgi:membrane protease YdiL (CAAX protease family)
MAARASFVLAFWNPEERRLRAPWRIVLQLALLAAIALPPVAGVGEGLSAAHRHGWFLAAADELLLDKVINLVCGPLFTVLVLASIFLATRHIDRRPFGTLGGPDGRSWWAELAFGLGVGALLQALVFASAWAAGWITVEATMRTESPALPLSLGLLYSIVKALCVGTYEEFLSRGYQLVNLTEGLTGVAGLGRGRAAVAAACVTAGIFAVLHAFNDNASAFSTAGLFVNGLLLATAPVLTGRLGIAIGIHIGWNTFEGSVFGFPVSGDEESASLLAIRRHGHELWTGGAFGPEAGLLGIAATLFGILIVVAWIRGSGRERRV